MSRDLDVVLDGVRAGLDEAAGHVDAICRAADAVLAGPGPEVADLRQSFAVVTQQLTGMLDAAGDPAALRAAGTAWVGAVCGPVSRLVGVATDGVLQTDDRWTGRAADAYRATLPAQRGALAAIVAVGQELDATLHELADAITRFWIAIGTACLGLVLALAGALGSAATVVGVPAAAGLALAGVGALVGAGSAALSSLTDITLAAATRGAALDRRLADDTAFPLGAWPRSTAAAPGDWQIR